MSRSFARVRDALGGIYDELRLTRPERRDRLARFELDRKLYTRDRIQLGRHTYGDPRIATFPGDTAAATIGSFGSIGPDVVLMDGGDHRVDWVSTFPFRARFGMPGAYEDGHPISRGDIVIGHDVWIGRGARIRSGVTVGNGAVIGAYAIVTRDVRPYAIVVGGPAREVRRRFTDAQIESLQAIAWWEWPIERIRRCVPELCSADIDRFIAQHRPAAESPASPIS